MIAYDLLKINEDGSLEVYILGDKKETYSSLASYWFERLKVDKKVKDKDNG